MPYHLEDTAWSPRRVLAAQTAHCLEGAIFAAAALRANKYPPLILDFEAEHDTDHVVAVFREKGHWGAVAKSNFTGCRYREPVYRSLRELAMSYFNTYFNLRRERTMRTFSRPVKPGRFDRQHWMHYSGACLVYSSLPGGDSSLQTVVAAWPKRLHWVDDRVFRAECLGKAYK